LFFRKTDKPGSHFSWATRDLDFGVKSSERLVTPKVGASKRLCPRDLMARGAARKRGVSKACPEFVEGHLPALGEVSAHGSVLRGRFAAL